MKTSDDINQLVLFTPLSFAAYKNNLDVVNALLKNGANPINNDLRIGPTQQAVDQGGSCILLKD